MTLRRGEPPDCPGRVAAGTMAVIDPLAEADRLSTSWRALAPLPVDPSPIIRTALPFYGVGLGHLEGLGRAWHREHAAATSEVLAVADALWARAVREDMVLAAMLVERRPEARDAFGLRRLDRWGALLDNWEATDNLGGRVVGPWAAADPGARLGTLERLAGRRNPWLRRLALVGCVHLGRRPDAAAWWPQVAELVLALAEDREAGIPKAVSWVLRAFTGCCPGEVASFLEAHGSRLPAIAVREARNKLATGYKAGKPRR
ncbi:MAG: DNA alkylation repair protein [Acidimicrobiia bacterium]|nr:DNA alkylation repair protein [Acidimicrobiia bacterium]